MTIIEIVSFLTNISIIIKRFKEENPIILKANNPVSQKF